MKESKIIEWEKEAKKDLELSKYLLDKQSERHASIILKWNLRRSKIRRSLNNQNAELEKRTAEIITQTKMKAPAVLLSLYGTKNPTQQILNSVVNNKSEICKLKTEIIKLENNNDLLNGILDSLKTKGFLIKGLIDLYTTDYFTISRITKTNKKGKKNVIS